MPKGGKRAGAGRKPSPDTPRRVVAAKVTDDEYATIQQAAGNNISQWAREVLLAKAREETERK